MLGFGIFRALKIGNSFNQFTLPFFAIVTGLILIVLLFAVYKTKFQTSLIGLLIVFIGVSFQFQRVTLSADPFRMGTALAGIAPFLAAFTFVFLIKWFLVFGNGNVLSMPHPDEVFSAKLSIWLSTTGNENFFLDYFYPQSQSVQPYHYFELWLASAIGFFFKLNNLYVLLFDVFTLLISICLVGLAGIFRTLFPSSKKREIYVAAFFGLIISGMIFPFFENVFLLDTASVFARNPWNYSKLSLIYLFIISSILLYLDKQEKAAIISLLFLPVVFISTAPGVMGVVSCYFLLDLILTKKWKMFLFQSWPIVALGLWFGVLYFGSYFGGQGNISSYHSGLSFNFFSFQYFKTMINVIGGATIQMGVIYLPIIILLGVFNRQIQAKKLYQEKFVLVLFSILALSLFSWAVLHQMPDSVQLFSNFSVSLLNIVSYIVLFWLFHLVRISWKKISLILVTAILMSTSVYYLLTEALSRPVEEKSEAALVKFFDQLKIHFKQTAPIGGFINDKSEYNSIFSKNSSFSAMGSYLMKINDQAHATSLSVFEIPLDSISQRYAFEKKMIESAPFYKFVMQQKEKSQYTNIAQSQLDFIEDFNIEYLVVSKQASISIQLESKIKNEVVHPMTGERVIFFKKEK